MANLDFKPKVLNKKFYTDFFSDFRRHPNKKDLILVTEEDSVRRALKNLLLTSKYERFFNQDFGGDIDKFLFEPIDNTSTAKIKQRIKVSIENYEKRVRLIDVLVTMDIDTQTMYISILFSLINKTEQLQLDLKIDRVR